MKTPGKIALLSLRKYSLMFYPSNDLVHPHDGSRSASRKSSNLLLICGAGHPRHPAHCPPNIVEPATPVNPHPPRLIFTAEETLRGQNNETTMKKILTAPKCFIKKCCKIQHFHSNTPPKFPLSLSPFPYTKRPTHLPLPLPTHHTNTPLPLLPCRR